MNKKKKLKQFLIYQNNNNSNKKKYLIHKVIKILKKPLQNNLYNQY
jgi:hypothetical protein